MPPAETLRAIPDSSPNRIDSSRTGKTLSKRRCSSFSSAAGAGDAGEEALEVSLMAAEYRCNIMQSKNLHVGTGRARAWGPPVAWAVTIFVLSSVPGSAYPRISFAGADKIVHLCLYGALGALFARALMLRSRLTGRQVAAVAAALATVYGVSDELHQLLVRGRSADVWDA